MRESDPKFATTQWTLVWEAAQEDSQHGRPALTEVVKRYWQPLYSYARRQGMTSQDAEDATQEFLSACLNGRLLESADPAKGKFRAFLLTAWKRFLVDQYRKDQAVKRGGNEMMLSLDVGSGEQNWLQVASKEPDADRVFMRSWAQSLLDEARNRLRQDYYRRNKSLLFERLLPRLTQPCQVDDYQNLAQELGISTSAVKVALHRLRQRFGQTLRDVVAETVEEPQDVDAELNELLNVLKTTTES